jgi:AcrR family transcriptional regulator
MSELGLRERKKLQTRRLIAGTAARLFAERGYENVTISDVARAAELSEQTIYNYFPGKEQLVTDLDQDIQARLTELIRERPPGANPAVAIRQFTLQFVDGIRDIDADVSRGELGYLAAVSPTVRRLALEMSDRQATTLSAVIAETSSVPPAVARLQGIALAGVFQIIVSESGQRARDGQSPDQIAAELRPAIVDVLDALERWFA